MALSIFKKHEPVSTTAGPARTTLSDHLHEIRQLQSERAAISARDGVALREVQTSLEAALPAQRLRAEIDRVRADALYDDTPPPDTSALERQLADAEQLHAATDATARAAIAVRARYAADAAKINSEIIKLAQATPRLLYSALVEEIEELRSKFEEAEIAMRTVHLKAFIAARAADRLAAAEKFGTFEGSAGYYDLQISRPATLSPVYSDAFERGRAIEAVHAKARADGVAIEKAADALIDRLLNPESAS